MSYKWIETNRLLRRLSDGACIPWPPGESEGFKAKEWIDAGNVPQPQDPDPVPDPRMVQDEAERVTCKGDAGLLALVNQTRQEWRDWAATNFPSLLTAGEKNKMGDICWLLAISIRKQLR